MIGRLLLLAMTGVVHASGADSCPCLSDLTTFGFEAGDPFPAIIGGERYIYPSGYGTGCETHDDGLEPYCGDSVELTDRFGDGLTSNWCTKPWCYVDISNCDKRTSQGVYNSDLHYSYATCGSTNTFDCWREGTCDRPLTDLITQVPKP